MFRRNEYLWIILQGTILLIQGFAWANFQYKTTELRLTRSNNHASLARWMENLPPRLHHVPLRDLAIPGSHDSCSYSITRTSAYSMALDSKAKKIVSYMDSTTAKDIVYRWSVTQSKNVKEQLENGIRYLDMRVSYNRSDGEIYVVHGLTGAKLDGILNQVKDFVTTFTKEAILMDFNHFYTPNQDKLLSTKLLLKKIQRHLGDHLCQKNNLGEITLDYLWRIKKQILFFLVTNLPHLPEYAWRSYNSILAPFDRVTFQDPGKWLNFLTKNYGLRRPDNKFYVTQGILQPHWIEVLAGQAVNATLKTWISQTANSLLVEWLSNRERGGNGINIVTADFIETFHFVPTVVSLNNDARRPSFVFRNLLIMMVINNFVDFF